VTPDEEWAELVAPYDAAAVALGFKLLDATRWTLKEYPSLTSFFHMHFDGSATFLDLGATIVRGAPPRGVVTGFNHIQFLTRTRDEEPFWILTNGTPPGYPLIRTPLFLRWIESRMPEHRKALPMRGAEDLPLVLERHRQGIGNRRVEVADPERPLDWRWEIMAAEEAEA
jgi:hypothetical protein